MNAPRPRLMPTLALSAAAGLALSGCAAAAAPGSDEGLSIVASTDVYGNIAAAIAGDRAAVTSIIDSPAQDPHSYEASAQDQLAIAGADLVIENGGGYDPFIDVLVDGSGTDAAVITAVAVAGLEGGAADEPASDEDADADAHAAGDHAAEDDDHAQLEGANEHVWYDVHVIGDVAEQIASALTELDTEGADDYAQNLAALTSDLEAVEGELEILADALGGGTIASTEPVPAYLLAELGLDDETPADFSEAIEEGADVPPLALQQTLDLIESGDVRLLAYNEQTASAETERVRTAAETAGIPVVAFTETLPEGLDYASWMSENIAAVAEALTPA